MIGMNRNDGALLSGRAYLIQRIHDVITTRVGTRVLRRHYGGAPPDLVDRKATGAVFARAAAAIAAALALWVPEFKIKRVTCAQPQPGQVIAVLTGVDVASGEPLSVDAAL